MKLAAAPQTSMMSFGRHFAADKLMLPVGSHDHAGATQELDL
jgi:hypothetical protein